MNFVFGFSVANGHDGHAKKAGGIEALLAAVIAGVFRRESRPVEYLFSLRELKPMFLQVGRALGCFPREVHEQPLYIR